MRGLFDPIITRGMLIGLSIGAILSVAARQFAHLDISVGHSVFWGAVIGGFAAYWPRFARLGAVITRRPQERQRNMVVGILALIAFSAIVMLLMLASGWLLTQCFPNLE